ncbi:receptor-like serine/threonine-protein kinase SD1-8-like, partial [Trifolium medium]|nr:receptor-like serine/threonine-protein kinase SD1-8-like [Trifolium medium]
FSPKNDQAWKLRDGCTRKTNLDCESDEFYEMENVKLPESTSVFVNNTMEIKECGGGGCVMWFGELVDIIKYRADGQELYIRRAYQKLGEYA